MLKKPVSSLDMLPGFSTKSTRISLHTALPSFDTQFKGIQDHVFKTSVPLSNDGQF